MQSTLHMHACDYIHLHGSTWGRVKNFIGKILCEELYCSHVTPACMCAPSSTIAACLEDSCMGP